MPPDNDFQQSTGLDAAPGVPFPGTRAEREMWWRNTFVVGQPHPFDVADGRHLTQEWVDETVTALLDSEDAANAR